MSTGGAVPNAMRIAVIGAGQIGAVVAGMLAEQGHQVTLADVARDQLALSAGGAFATSAFDASDQSALLAFLSTRDIVVSACPYFLNKGIATAAVQTRTHY